MSYSTKSVYYNFLIYKFSGSKIVNTVTQRKTPHALAMVLLGSVTGDEEADD